MSCCQNSVCREILFFENASQVEFREVRRCSTFPVGKTFCWIEMNSTAGGPANPPNRKLSKLPEQEVQPELFLFFSPFYP